MQDLSFTRKMVVLGILLVVVLGIFFLQQRPNLSSGPRPTPTPIASPNGAIQVTVPFHEGSVGPDFVVQGIAKTPSTTVTVRVLNRLHGNIYYEGTVQTYPEEQGAPGVFQAIVEMNTNDTTLRPNDKLTLEVFHTTQGDPTERDKVTYPLYFSPELP